MSASAPHFLGLRTVVYHVPDRERAREWYRTVLGQDPYFDEPFYVGFSVGGFELGLDPSPTAGTAGPGGATAYWGVASLDAAMARLRTLDAPVVQEPTDVGGGIRLATVRDPFGNVFGIIENPGFQAGG